MISPQSKERDGENCGRKIRLGRPASGTPREVGGDDEDEAAKADRRSALGKQTRKQRSPKPGCRGGRGRGVSTALWWGGVELGREGGGSSRSSNQCEDHEQPLTALTQNQQQVR